MRRSVIAFATSLLALSLFLAISSTYPTTFGSVVQIGQSANVAAFPTASLVPGAIGFATSELAHQNSNGTVWAGPPLVAPWSSVSNYDAADATEAVSFLGPLVVRASRTYYLADIACNWDFAGVGGTTGVVAEVYNLTGAAQVGVCTLGACTTAALTPVTCALNANFAPGALSTLVVRLTSATDCTNNPQRIACTVSIQSGP